MAICNPQLARLVSALLDWFSAHARDLPWRRTRDPYAIWVSEIMLQQTQVKTVIPYWERWMREFPTLQAVAKASPDKIHKLWEGLGYYTRVRNLQQAAKQIVAQHDARSEAGTRRGLSRRSETQTDNESQTKKKSETPYVVSCKFPDNFDEVLALPGIGRYTAGAICSIAFNQPTPILDGNVIRVLTRVFGISANPREKQTNAQLWQLAEGLVRRAVPGPPRRGGDTAPHHSFLNQSLMELGALICTPRNPQCKICPVKKLCVAFREDRAGQLPNLGKRPEAATRRFMAFAVERRGRFLVRQRPAGVVNAHLWEFPNAEVNGAGTKDVFKSIFGIAPPFLQSLCTIKHSITRYRITLEAFYVQLGGRGSPTRKITRTRSARPSETGVWLTPVQMNRLAFASAHKKLASAAADCILSSR